jgi:hypothetical protein
MKGSSPMARTPIGERAMTSTERSRRRRLRLKKGLGGEKASLARAPRPPSEWAQIRAEYERGASLRAVASRHELSHTAVAKKAKAQDWRRPPPEDDGLKLLHIDDLKVLEIDDLMKVLEIDDLKVPEIDDLLPGSSLTADR